MTNKDLLCRRIEETRKNAIRLLFAGMMMKKSCKDDKDIKKEWALKAEEMLDDIDSKYEEFYKYCIDLYGETLNEQRTKQNCR